MVVSTTVLLVAAFVVASLFAYYPLQLTISPAQPPIVFQPGSSAGGPDLHCNVIQVCLGAGGTSAKVMIHPTYQTTYYKDVIRLKNNDNKVYDIFLVLGYKSDLPKGFKIYLMVFANGATRGLQAGTTGVLSVIDITGIDANVPQSMGRLSANGIWEIDFIVHIPEGTNVGGLMTFMMHIVYAPSAETPP